MNKFTLSKDHKYLTLEHEDMGGGCCHDFTVKQIVKAIKPALKDAEEKCARCGRPLVVPQELDNADMPEGKVCMICLGGS